MNILIISAHPDDETIGCGGTILKHKAAGDDLLWLIVTQTFTPQWTNEVIRRKALEVEKVAGAYQFTKTYKLGLETTRLDTLPQVEIIEKIRKVAQETKPDWVYLVNRSDVHSDHRIVFNSTMAVFKPFFKEFGAKRIFSYECLSSTDVAPQIRNVFIPNIFSNITPYMDRKIEIMKMYETEIQKDPLPRGPSAIRALARYRGATIGVEYAEAFMLIREVS